MTILGENQGCHWRRRGPAAGLFPVFSKFKIVSFPDFSRFKTADFKVFQGYLQYDRFFQGVKGEKSVKRYKGWERLIKSEFFNLQKYIEILLKIAILD